jgi:hypothetical protein
MALATEDFIAAGIHPGNGGRAAEEIFSNNRRRINWISRGNPDK